MTRYNDVNYEHGSRKGPREGERGFFRRAEDEVRSWFGDEEASRRRSRDEYEDDQRHSQGRYSRSGRRGDDLCAGDLMSRNAVTVRPRDSVNYAARMMREWDCGSIPVVDQAGRLIGIVTDRDIVMRLVAKQADTRDSIVSDCMTDGAFACSVYDSIGECLRQMSRHQVRRLPVVDDTGKVVGVISQSDLARHAVIYPGHGERRVMADVLGAISEPARASRR